MNILEQITDALEIEHEDMHHLYDKQNKEVIQLTSEELHIAEEEYDLDDYPQWQWDNIKLAEQVHQDWDRFITLPHNRFDYNPYDIMKFFISTLSEDVQPVYYDLIQGRGAFRRFKDKVFEDGIEKEWFDYRRDTLESIARKFCQKNDIEIE